MGFTRDGFSTGTQPRWARISATLHTLRRILRELHEALSAVRRQVPAVVPDIEFATDLRLRDIILWTSRDDRMHRSGSPENFWLTRPPRDYGPPRLDPVTL